MKKSKISPPDNEIIHIDDDNVSSKTNVTASLPSYSTTASNLPSVPLRSSSPNTALEVQVVPVASTVTGAPVRTILYLCHCTDTKFSALGND